MKKRNIILATLVVLIAIVAVPFVYGRPGGHGHGAMGMGPGGMGHGGHGFEMLAHLGHLKSELGLTDAQVDQLKAIAKEVHEQNAPYHDQLKAGMKSIAQTLLANPNDVAGAQALIDGQSAAERALKTNILNGVSRALNVLTPEQRAKLAAHLAKMAQRWENREQ
jgi:protein CpxP